MLRWRWPSVLLSKRFNAGFDVPPGAVYALRPLAVVMLNV
jgi:hypothetical protein